ncbi:GNAT family N-acetyltransferase [Thalassovita sp.]|uniref:GNAT family N-acetyltransferase n=1 Tax=Thalassovita sp. TaxID=1979401 RepID=UPI002AB20576|nr:GNAT family N-acetyltransferase [Thalassovita sp.]
MSKAKPFWVREATHRDRFALLDLSGDYFREAALPIPFDPAHVSMTICEFTSAPDRLALVLEISGRVSGFLFAGIYISPLAPVLVAQELAWWVDPGARGRSARAMIPAYEAWARSQGCNLISVAGRCDPRLARFYRANGYAPIEDHFMKELS